MLRRLLAVVFAIVAASAWMIVLPPAPVAQPLAFNHRAHAPMACRVCHPGVERAAAAQLPGGATCTNCHATAPRTVAEAGWKPIQDAATPRWIRVTRAPQHVLFSHRRHVALGRLACESCHGDIASRTSPPPRAAARLDMDACISCHRQEAVSDDCAACHR